MLDDRVVREAHDIAIVGMACRFPGARNINEYWKLLRYPKPQFSVVPEARWRHQWFLSDDPAADPHSAYSDKMATLADVGAFDAAHFKIPPQRTRALDPMHWLMVNLAREAIQDAGWEVDGFDRANTSVIVGLSDSGYREISTVQLRVRQLEGGEFGRPATDPNLWESASAVEPFHASAVSGMLLSMGAGSISSVFGVHGESYCHCGRR